MVSGSLEWVSQLWGDRRCKAAHIVPLGLCETDTDLVMDALLRILLPSAQAAYVAYDLRFEDQKTVLPHLLHLRLQHKLRHVLLNAVVGTRLFLIAEKGAGCVKHCIALTRTSLQRITGVEIMHCSRARAIEGYNDGHSFLVVDLTDCKRAHLLSLPSAAYSSNGLVLDDGCWTALLAKHRDALPCNVLTSSVPVSRAVALPVAVVDPCAVSGEEVMMTRALLKRAHAALVS